MASNNACVPILRTADPHNTGIRCPRWTPLRNPVNRSSIERSPSVTYLSRRLIINLRNRFDQSLPGLLCTAIGLGEPVPLGLWDVRVCGKGSLADHVDDPAQLAPRAVRQQQRDPVISNSACMASRLVCDVPSLSSSFTNTTQGSRDPERWLRKRISSLRIPLVALITRTTPSATERRPCLAGNSGEPGVSRRLMPTSL